jgi:hypothetical protein
MRIAKHPFVFKLFPYGIAMGSLLAVDIILILGIFDNPLRATLLDFKIIFPGILITGMAGLILCQPIYRKILQIFSRFFKYEFPSESQLYKPKTLDRALYFHLILTIILLFINTKMLYQFSDLSRSSDDTVDFILGSAKNPLTLDFWTAYKPPLLPLLIRMLGYTSGDPLNHKLLDDVAKIQLTISAAAWTILALSIVLYLKERFAKITAILVVLFFSASLDISLWDRLTLSESLSLSFFALWLASLSLIMLIFNKPIRNPWIQTGFLIIFIITTFFYANARDTNIYFVAMTIALLVTWVIIFKQINLLNQKFFLLVVLSTAILFLYHSYIYDISNRWHPVIMDVMTDRLSTNIDAISFFEESGMPTVKAILGKTSYNDFHSFLDSKRFQVVEDDPTDMFNAWFINNGKKIYISYLLHNPITTIIEPLKSWKLMLLENNYIYREANGSISMRIIWLTRLFFPYNQTILLFLCLFLLCFFAIALRKDLASNPLWFIISSLLLTIPPLMILIWVGGSLEIPRHAFQVSLQFRLALWIGLILGVDFMIGTRWFSKQLESLE